MVFTPSSGSATLLCLLRGLGTQFHENVHKGIRAKGEQGNNSRIPPSVVVIHQVDAEKIIATPRILTHAATGGRVRIQEIHASAHALHKFGEVLAAGAAIRGIEEGVLRVLALHIHIEDGEGHHATHEIVERVHPVDPVPPEGLDLLVGHHDTTERGEGSNDHWVN